MLSLDKVEDVLMYLSAGVMCCISTGHKYVYQTVGA